MYERVYESGQIVPLPRLPRPHAGPVPFHYPHAPLTHTGPVPVHPGHRPPLASHAIVDPAYSENVQGLSPPIPSLRRVQCAGSVPVNLCAVQGLSPHIPGHVGTARRCGANGAVFLRHQPLAEAEFRAEPLGEVEAAGGVGGGDQVVEEDAPGARAVFVELPRGGDLHNVQEAESEVAP